MSRIIVLDTETTGLEVTQGHRIIEIGCIELCERRRSGRTFHRYLNPERRVDAGALAVHGLDDAFLADKPRFAEIADELLGLIRGAELVIHNAAFDIGFLEAELARLNPPRGRVSEFASVLDTLALARERFPGQRNSLDALCKRLGVDNSARELHGALLDAELLTEVFISLTAGQTALNLDLDDARPVATPVVAGSPLTRRPRVLRADAAELAAHQARLDALDHQCKARSLWRRQTQVD